jgi:hypothetical protein
MPPFYKRFARVRTAPSAILFALLVAMAFLMASHAVHAEPYIVEGIEVDISAENAIKARDMAFAKAQQEAFKKLAAQLLDETSLASVAPPSDGALSSMIRDYEVTKEKLSSTRYVATYTFTFKQRAVDSFFGRTNAPADMPFDQAAQPNYGSGGEPQTVQEGLSTNDPGAAVNHTALRPRLLVLPFIRAGSETLLWSPRNVWMQAWNRTKLDSSLLMPIGDISDITDIGDNNAYGFDAEKMRRMLVRYGARESVIVIAAPDAALLRAQTDTAPAYGTLRVEILRTDEAAGPRGASAMVLNAMPGETRGMLFNRAVVAVQRALAGDWKNNTGGQMIAGVPAQNYAPHSSPNTGVNANKIPLRFRFVSLQEWARVRDTLRRVPGVQDVVLTSMSLREARIAMDYNGDVNALRIALMQSGLSLSDQPANNAYDLSGDLSGTARQPQTPPSDKPASGGAYMNRF